MAFDSPGFDFEKFKFLTKKKKYFNQLVSDRVTRRFETTCMKLRILKWLWRFCMIEKLVHDCEGFEWLRSLCNVHDCEGFADFKGKNSNVWSIIRLEEWW